LTVGDCLPAPLKDRAHVDAIYFASTTIPFADRLNAGIVAGALGLTHNLGGAPAMNVCSVAVIGRADS
jgi:3-hydroxy-3-methylglutaryl CoA synthase